MPYVSLNPANNQILKTFPSWDEHRLAEALRQAHFAHASWREVRLSERAACLHAAAGLIRHQREELAKLITLEIGKLLREAKAEVEKCALVCEYYAAHGAHFLAAEPVETDAGNSYVTCEPLGTILAVMPWNFPFWQVFRFAAPCLMAGNTALLKHASNVPQCALAIEQIFRASGFPEHAFTTLMIEAAQVEDVIASHYVQAVTLTGSAAAGRKVAALAGQHLKKCVLELGGSDPFIVLADADLDYAVQMAVASRFLNAGQSCIAAKRIILLPEIAEAFVAKFQDKIAALNPGDPLDDATQIAPMARLDLREELHRQVSDSIAQGAVALLGCQPIAGEGCYYQPSILDRVTHQCRAYHEELFGPVAVVIRAEDEADALRIANDTPFGLGASIWSRDTQRAEQLAQQIQSGSVFINGMVKSDPRLPFGGIKMSGFGRELSYQGLREFVNVKTVWVK